MTTPDQERPLFCSPMERHYMTKAAANAATALSMAKELVSVWRTVHRENSMPDPEGVHDLVQIINDASKRLIQRCKVASSRIKHNEWP